MTSRADALELDHADPLARWRDEFVVADPELAYFDGNSLGRVPKRAAASIAHTVEAEWGAGLVRSWSDWLGLSERVGDRLAPLLGASAGQVALCDQTSVNLYKLAHAALASASRKSVLSDAANFPSDLYVLDAVARAHGGLLRRLETDPIGGPTPEAVARALTDDVGLVSLSIVAYKSAALCDVAAITRVAHERGALVLWDASHAVGALQLELDAAQADLAVGCTYKYLNGGPGAPAFLYVRRELQERLVSPIPGWFGHDDLFAFEPEYRPAAGIRRFTVGSPPVLSLRGAEAGIALMAEVGMQAIRTKSVALSELFIERFDARLADLGLELASPRDPQRRGSHLSLAHPEGFRITQALIARGVIADFRTPDTVRFGFAPLYNGFRQVFDATEALAEIVEQREYERFDAPVRGQVT